MYTTRPVTINEATWDFLVDSLRETTQEERPALLEKLGYPLPPKVTVSDCLPIIALQPIPFLIEAGFLERADLLVDTIFSNEDDLEFHITSEAAVAISNQEELIPLERFYGHIPTPTPYEMLRTMFEKSSTFDQLEQLNLERYQPKQLQRAIDRFQVGKLFEVSDHHPYFAITTNKGKYVLAELDDISQTQLEKAKQHVDQAFGPAELLFPPDEKSPHVHQKDRYYVLFRLV